MDLRFERVGHSYGAVQALADVDLEVRSGETLALIGPSGCGKSTLLAIAGGLLRPTQGRVTSSGRAREDSLNPFTYIFQDFALLPWRTVAANVGLPLEHHGIGVRDRAARVADALTITGLSEFADAFPKQLSGGMRQRVGIARALVVRPDVLLLDEPLSALDAQTRELLAEDLLQIWEREPGTRLYVTHNLQEAVRLADRVAVLSRRPGRLRQVVSIDVPVKERAEPRHAARLAELNASLWSLISGEARAAEREIQHG